MTEKVIISLNWKVEWLFTLTIVSHSLCPEVCILVKNKRTHAGQKSFSTSSHCGKTFADSSTLKQHKRTYTSEKPFCCSNGEKIFTQWSTLKEHEKNQTGEKPLSCSHCDKTFCQFKCFESAKKTHTWVKPFSCSHSDNTFAHWSTLKQHELTHPALVRHIL